MWILGLKGLIRAIQPDQFISKWCVQDSDGSNKNL